MYFLVSSGLFAPLKFWPKKTSIVNVPRTRMEFIDSAEHPIFT